MANNLSKQELLKIISDSEKRTSDPDVGKIARQAIVRARALLDEQEKNEQTNGKNQPATAANSQSRSNNTHSTNTAPTTANTAANNANTTRANAATTQQSTGNTPQENYHQQQPADNQPIGSTATTSDAGSGPTIIVDGKEMTMGEVKSKIITYLNHSSSSQSVLAANWGLYIQRQTFRTLLFWMQAFAMFPRPSMEEFPTKEDIGDYFRGKDRKSIYNLIKAAHENEGDVTKLVENISNYLNQ